MRRVALRWSVGASLLAVVALGKTAHAATQVFDALTPDVVRGLQGTLRRLHKHGSIGRGVRPEGGLVQSRLRLGTCRAVRDPYGQSWSCFGDLTATFGVATTNQQPARRLRDWTVRVGQQVFYEWNATARRLFVTAVFSDPEVTSIAVRYGVRMTSDAPVASVGAGDIVAITVFDQQLGPLVGITALKDGDALVVRVDGMPSWVAVGAPTLDTSQGDEAVLSTSITWYSTATLEFEEAAVPGGGSCLGRYQHTRTARLDTLDLPGQAPGPQATATVQVCLDSPDVLVPHFRFTTSNPFGGPTPAAAVPNAFGQQIVSSVRIGRSSGGTCSAQYDVTFSALLDWELDAAPLATFTLPKHQVVAERSKATGRTTYRCQ